MIVFFFFFFLLTAMKLAWKLFQRRNQFEGCLCQSAEKTCQRLFSVISPHEFDQYLLSLHFSFTLWSEHRHFKLQNNPLLHSHWMSLSMCPCISPISHSHFRTASFSTQSFPRSSCIINAVRCHIFKVAN